MADVSIARHLTGRDVMDHEMYMKRALGAAEKAALIGEVPVGAVVVVNGAVIAEAHNEVELRQDATAHAEMLALQLAASKLGSWRLSEVNLYVTLEPCSMCIGAMILSRIGSLTFGAFDPKQGAVGSLFDLSAHPSLPHEIPVTSGLLAEESEALLKSFFERRRRL